MLDRLKIIMETGDFNVRQIAVLILLSLEGGTLLHRIAAELHMSSPAACRAADRLCISGLALRERPQEDRRQCLVTITRAGEKLVAAFSK